MFEKEVNELLNYIEKESYRINLEFKLTTPAISFFDFGNENIELSKRINQFLMPKYYAFLANIVIKLYENIGIECKQECCMLDYGYKSYYLHLTNNNTNIRFEKNTNERIIDYYDDMLSYISAPDGNDLYNVYMGTIYGISLTDKFINEHKYYENIRSNLYIMDLRTFILKEFGISNYLIVDNVFKILSKEIPLRIGLSVMEVCNKTLKKTFRDDIIKNSIISKENDRIFKNNYKYYLDKNFDKKLNENINIIYSEKEYAESLFTSDWIFSKDKNNELLEKTYVVIGYLKSIEQLLSQILIIKGHDKNIKLFNGTNSLIDTKDLKELNASIGNLNLTIFKQHILTNNYELAKYVFEVIDEWREFKRNGHAHKDNIYTNEEVLEIRKSTYYVWYLLLGLLDISAEERLAMM